MKEIKSESTVLDGDSQELPRVDLLWDIIKDRLCLRLLEVERNKERLSNVSYEEVGNGLALIMDIDTSYNSKIEERTIVGKALSDRLKIDEKELFDIATSNAQVIKPPVLSFLESSITDSHSENLLTRTEPMQTTENEGMFLLTTKGRWLGACALFYPGIKERVADIIGSGYYILPSSIHEMILLSDCKNNDEKFMCELVTSVNKYVVNAEDVLSDNVFHYNKDTHNIEIVRINKQ